MKTSIYCAALALASGLLAWQAAAQPPEPVFANDYVQAYRVTLAPGEGLSPHEGAERVVYSLSDYTIEWTEAGKSSSQTWREGEVHAHAALEHGLTNTGNTIADFLVVARNGAAVPDTAVSDAAAVSGGYAALIAEPEGYRVLRVALPPRATQPLHEGYPRLVYSLNDYAVVFTGPDGLKSKVNHAGGDFHWHDAGMHAVENTGNDTARFVIFAIK